MKLLLVIILAAAGAWAQSANISGLVTDPSGSVVPNANVTALNKDTGSKHTSATNAAGLYSVVGLIPGQYQILAAAAGFQTASRDNVMLDVAQNARLDFKLDLGKNEQTITILGESPLINSNDGSVSSVVSREFVENLPLNGRSFQSLIELAPGVTTTPASFGQPGQFSVNGQRADTNYFTVDGVSANISVSAGAGIGPQGAGALPAFTINGGTNSLISVDALQEFRIQTSTYAPEYGRSPGAQVSLSSRSGTNAFHGTLFDYFRNEALDANDWFNNRNRLSKAPERQNDFGGVLGGPIRRDRTFFFASYEGLRLYLPQTALTAVPSLDARQQAPAALQPYLNAFPIPNGPAVLAANGSVTNLSVFNASFSVPATVDAGSIRLDHRLNDRVYLFGRVNIAPSSADQWTGAYAVNSHIFSTTNIYTYTAGATAIISPTLVNEARFNWSKAAAATSYTLSNYGGAVVPDNSVIYPSPYSFNNGFFSFVIVNGTATQVAYGKNVSNYNDQMNFNDAITITVGRHNLKTGFDIRRILSHFGTREYSLQPRFSGIGLFTSNPSSQPGTIVSGIASSVRVGNSVPTDIYFDNYSAFAQDTWTVSRTLTITYGLRWDVNPAPTADKPGLYTAQGLANPATATLAPAGTPLYTTSFLNLQPRIGGAYRIRTTPGRELVLRGGFGIFYDIGSQGAASAVAPSEYPFGTTVTYSTVAFPLSAQFALPPPITSNPPIPALYAFSPNLHSPRTEQWNIWLEQAMSAHSTLSLGYVGAAGRNLLRTDTIANNPLFTGLYYITNNARSDYDALQAQWRARPVQGMELLAAYTWSHALDNNSAISNLTPPASFYPPSLDKGSSDFDVRQQFRLSGIYNLPETKRLGPVLRGWSLDSIFSASSALPVTPIYSAVTGTSVYTLRPDLVPGQPLYLEGSTFADGRRFNPAAFAIPSTLRQGTLGRNTLRGFPAEEWDVALRRRFNLTEHVTLHFRIEAFNVLNHPNFSPPNSNVQSASFGISSSMLNHGLGAGGANGGLSPLYQTGGPRSLQAAIKLQF